MFEKFPHTQKVIEDLEYENYVGQTEWLYSDEDTALTSLAKMIITAEQLTSSNIPEILAAKTRVNNEYLEAGRMVHVFARNEARHQLNLSNNDVTKLFSQVEIGGTRLTN